MTLANLWDSLLAILRKESKGLAVSPDNFSDLLQVENLALFNEYYRGFEVNQSLTDAMQPFKAFAPIGLTYDYVTHANYGNLPADYSHAAQIESVDVLDMVPNPAGTYVSTPWKLYSLTEGVPDEPTYTSFTRTSNNVYRIVKSLTLDEAYRVTEDLQTYETYTNLGVYQLELTLEDLSVSSDSDLPYYFKITASSGSTYYRADLSWGTNLFYFTATTTPITLLFYHEAADLCDIQATFKITKQDPNNVYVFDRVTDEEWGQRRKDALTKPTEEYPIAKIADGKIYTLPISLGNVILYYLRTPATPYFDYYTDANLNIQPLAEDESYTLKTNEDYHGTTSGTIASETVELEWADIDQIKILHRILAKLGVSMDEQLVAQYALSQKDS